MLSGQQETQSQSSVETRLEKLTSQCQCQQSLMHHAAVRRLQHNLMNADCFLGGFPASLCELRLETSEQRPETEKYLIVTTMVVMTPPLACPCMQSSTR